jgi:hypothetical protein
MNFEEDIWLVGPFNKVLKNLLGWNDNHYGFLFYVFRSEKQIFQFALFYGQFQVIIVHAKKFGHQKLND